jgi:hypothetical protein
MGADDEAGAPSRWWANACFSLVASAWNVDHDRVGLLAERAGGEFAVDGRERIVERIHEDAAHDIDDKHPAPLRATTRLAPRPGVPGGKVGGPDQARLPLDEDERLALVPDMIAERDDVGACVDEVLADLLGDAEAAGGVLAVDDDEVEAQVADQRRQVLGDRRSPGPSHHVAHEQKPHRPASSLRAGRSSPAPSRSDAAARRAAPPEQVPFPAPRSRRRSSAVFFPARASRRSWSRNKPFRSRSGSASGRRPRTARA